MSRLFSIIIPTYNTPIEYLENCISSILQQTFDDYEIIIIDDGSTQKPRGYLDVLLSRDSRIKIIYNKHGGVSVARNKGIEVAEGEYLIFIDADDIISESFFGSAYRIIQEYKYPDVIIGGLKYDPYRKCNDTQYGEQIDFYVDTEVDLIKESMMHIKNKVGYYILGTPCSRVYKKEIVEKTYFPEDVALCEDQVFNRRNLLLSKSVVVVPEMWYVYIQREDSVMHTKVKDNFWEMINPYWNELLKLDQIETMKNKDGLRGFYIRSFYNVVSMYAKDNSISINKKFKVIQKAMNHPLIQHAIKKLSITSKLPLDRKVEWLLLKIKIPGLVYVLGKIL